MTIRGASGRPQGSHLAKAPPFRYLVRVWGEDPFVGIGDILLWTPSKLAEVRACCIRRSESSIGVPDLLLRLKKVPRADGGGG